jgi:hypothetical protein
MTVTTLGIIADTHIPDARRQLHPRVRPVFEEAGVGAILHAGDISIPRGLRDLEAIAPVLAVRGNRDWFGFEDLRLNRIIQVAGATIGLTHGHANLYTYIYDKLRFFVRGPRSFEYFARQAEAQLPPDMDAVVFGHNHEPMIQWRGKKLIFNPGSASYQVLGDKPPSVGLLHIEDGRLRPELVYLEDPSNWSRRSK